LKRNLIVTNLSPAGKQLVQDLTQRYGVSTDAVTHMLIAVNNGNGTMAQFSHPEFGGSGQWMKGGMTMVSDLFNHQLKVRVDNICSEISNALAHHQLVPSSGSFQSQSQNGMHSQTQANGTMGSSNDLFLPDPEANWWPSEFGSPAATGAQNNVRYAYFPVPRRLAVKTGGSVWVYDTLHHQIGGFSQQQGGGSSITFSSQSGTVDLSTLPVVSRDGVPTPAASDRSMFAEPRGTAEPPRATEQQPQAATNKNNPPQIAETSSTQPSSQLDQSSIIDTLDRLGGLHEKGYITDEEFAAKKAELLGRL